MTKKYITIESDIQSLIFDTIKKKTGLLFTSERLYHAHPLLPKTLRELHHFYFLLQDLDEFEPLSPMERDQIFSHDAELIDDSIKRQIETNRKNITFFENYFFSVWAPTVLPSSLLEFVNELSSTPLDAKNKFVCTKLLQVVEKYYNTTQTTSNSLEIRDTSVLHLSAEYDLKEIISIKNNPANVSIGDVLFLLKVIKDKCDTKIIDHFTFCIKSHYSFFLIKLIEIETWERVINTSQDLKKDCFFDFLKQVKLLIGETIYSPHALNLLSQTETQKSVARNTNLKNGSTQTRSNFQFVSYAKKAKAKKIDKTVFDLMRLFLSYHNRFNPSYRNDIEPVSEKKLHNQTDVASFHLLSIFTNLLSPSDLRDRDKTGFIEAQPIENSLIETIEKWLMSYGPPIPFYDIEFIESTFYSFRKSSQYKTADKVEKDDNVLYYRNKVFLSTYFVFYIESILKSLPIFENVFSNSPIPFFKSSFFKDEKKSDDEKTNTNPPNNNVWDNFVQYYSESMSSGFTLLQVISNNYLENGNKDLTQKKAHIELLKKFLEEQTPHIQGEELAEHNKIITILKGILEKKNYKYSFSEMGKIHNLFQAYYENKDIE